MVGDKEKKALTCLSSPHRMESFVARHVLIKLLFDGDMDGLVVDPNTGDLMKAPKLLGFINRRRFWTFVIYVATLIPALIVNDLGPVLSITGAIGGCSLAYIGPGLAYLGAHGDAFLSFLSGAIESKEPANKPSIGDIPVEGDPTASIQVHPPPLTPQGSKPWWWWPLLMPIWVSIATTGSQGMNERMTALEQEHGPLLHPESEHPDYIIDLVPFRKRDAWISIFFIVFGIIALIAGIVSNIYAQIHDIFYSPA